MKFVKNISLVLMAAAALWSCESYEKTMVKTDLIEPAVFTSYPSAIVTLDKAQPDLSQVTLGWTAAKFGYSAAVTYTLQAALESAENKTWVEVGQTNTLSISLQNKALCTAIVKGLGVTPLTTATIDMRLLCSIGANQYDTVSLPVVLSIIPFSLEPTPLWVIGDYCDWSHDKAIKIYSENSNNIYKGWVYMNKASEPVDKLLGFKFTTQADWNGKNYGGTLAALDDNGGAGNIEIENGYTYLFTVDIAQLKATVDKKISRLGMVGSATPNDWNSPDTELKWDASKKLFRATGVAMKAGAFKFRANDDWSTIDWGAGAAAGQLNLAGGGGDITFSGADGNYTVEVDLCKLQPTYTLTKE